MELSGGQQELEDEVSVVNAIFGAENPTDVQDLRQADPWKVWRPPELLLKLYPTKGISGYLEAFATVQLHIKCPKMYPKIMPELKIKESKGLSEDDLKELRKKLAKKAKSLLGQVMITELCTEVSDFLHSHNHPPQYVSFYEGMLQENERRAQESTLHAKAIEEREAEEIGKELERRRREKSQPTHDGNIQPSTSPSHSHSDNDDQSKGDYGRTRSSSATVVSGKKEKQGTNRARNRGSYTDLSVVVDPVENTPEKKTKEGIKPGRRRRTISSTSVPTRHSTSESTLPDPFASTRLEKEFQFIEWIGKGGYGNVMKVRNRLDDNYYAIKKIPLDPLNKNLNRKMLREVKLLSKINHENVVRYYNSWLETRLLPQTSISADNSGSSLSTSTNQPGTKAQNDELFLEQFNPDTETVCVGSGRAEWAVSFTHQWASTTGDRKSSVRGDWLLNSSDEDESSESEEESDEENHVGPTKHYTLAGKMEQSGEMVVFEGTEGVTGEYTTSTEIQEAAPVSTTQPLEEQTLYIQMEYCEKKSLRELINSGELTGQPTKTWTLFREILEGLNHIHSQAGMIHRDIKPVNIFLDSQGHAKIGDFGLAVSRQNRPIGTELDQSIIEMPDDESSQFSPGMIRAAVALSLSTAGSALTTQIGTAFYVAPEILGDHSNTRSEGQIGIKEPDNHFKLLSTSTVRKEAYSQKVDIYSTGIVLFELFYRPLPLGMERNRTLTDLRSESPIFPDDFGAELPSKTQERVRKIILWCLQYSPELRPTADELLRSDLLPPVEMQEAEFQKTFHKHLSLPQTRIHRWIMGEIFHPKRFPTSAQDFCFDHDINEKVPFDPRLQVLRSELEGVLTGIFTLHGAIKVPSSIFLPKNPTLDTCSSSFGPGSVKVLDESGMQISLPWDLRFAFARFVVRKQIQRLKRYDFGPVYRPVQPIGSHPRVTSECAVDIVCPPRGANTAVAETLKILSEIVDQFAPMFETRKPTLKLGHTGLIDAILAHLGITDRVICSKILRLLETFKFSYQQRNRELGLRMTELGLTEQTLSNLKLLLDLEDQNLSRVTGYFRIITKGKNHEAGKVAKDAFAELQKVMSSAESLEVSLPITVTPSLVFRPEEYGTGIVFQLVYEFPERKKNKKSKTFRQQQQKEALASDGDSETRFGILAAGGRYDSLVGSFRKPAMEDGLIQPVAAVGVSISMDSLISIVVDGKHTGNSVLGSGGECGVEVLVCSMGGERLQEKLRLLRDLWNHHIAADYLLDAVGVLDELKDHCRDRGIWGVVMLRPDTVTSVPNLKDTVLLHIWDERDGRFSERKTSPNEVVPILLGVKQDQITTVLSATEQRHFPAFFGGLKNPSVDYSSTVSLDQTSARGHGQDFGSGGGQSAGVVGGGGGVCDVRVQLISCSGRERLSGHKRKVIDTQIRSALQGVVGRLNPRCVVEVFGMDVPKSVIGTLAACLEWKDSVQNFRESAKSILSQLPNKHKDRLEEVLSGVEDLVFGDTGYKSSSGDTKDKVIVLYSFSDDFYRLLL